VVDGDRPEPLEIHPAFSDGCQEIRQCDGEKEQTETYFQNMRGQSVEEFVGNDHGEFTL